MALDARFVALPGPKCKAGEPWRGFFARLWARPSQYGPWTEGWVVDVERGAAIHRAKVRLFGGEWCPAGARASFGCWWRVGCAAPVVRPPAAGKRLETRILGCCGAGRSVVAWVWRVLRWFVCSWALLPLVAHLMYGLS